MSDPDMFRFRRCNFTRSDRDLPNVKTKEHAQRVKEAPRENRWGHQTAISQPRTEV